MAAFAALLYDAMRASAAFGSHKHGNAWLHKHDDAVDKPGHWPGQHLSIPIAVQLRDRPAWEAIADGPWARNLSQSPVTKQQHVISLMVACRAREVPLSSQFPNSLQPTPGMSLMQANVGIAGGDEMK